MKRLPLTRNLRVPPHAPDFCTLPLNRSLFSASSTTLFEILFRGSQLIGAWGLVWRAAAESPRTSTPFCPTIEFA
jgi:hypothetical protein